MTEKLLSRDAILGAADLPQERVSVPEWGGTVILRGMSGAERDAFEAGIMVTKGDKDVVDPRNLRARLIVRCVIDEDGKRLFADEDAEFLGAKSASVISRLFDVARRLCGMGENDINELRANFADGPDDASPSDSPSPSEG